MTHNHSGSTSESRQQRLSNRSHRDYLEDIVNNANTPIFLKSSDYRYIFMNREFERLIQATLQDVKGKDDFAIFPQPVAELFRSQDEEVVKRRTVVEFEETVLLAAGEYAFITAKFPLFDSDGEIDAIGGVCTDITARMRSEAGLREAEERYHSIFDHSPLGIFQIDDTGTIKACNEKLAEILGTEVDKVTGLSVLTSLNDDKIKEAAETVLSGRIAHHEGMYQSVNSHKRIYIRGLFSPIFSPEGAVVSAIGIVEDITIRKETEKALRDAHDELEQRVADRTAELNRKTRRLEETNTALEVLLEKRDRDIRECEKKVRQNIEKLIRPYLEKLELSSGDYSKEAILRILHTNLNEITNSLAPDWGYQSVLTPAQVQVADLIKHGHTTKEIAYLLNLSPSTIACHRQEIRKRLSLTNKSINLQSALKVNSSQ